jgi:hypothetical protein
MRNRNCQVVAIVGTLLAGTLRLAAADDNASLPVIPEGNVGMQVAIDDLVLPGTQLEPAPVVDATPVIIRIDAVSLHGSALRYDLVCSGLEPGEFDLRKYLRRKDGSTTDDLPALNFKVSTLLPPGQIEPHPLEAASLPWLGNYRALLVLGGMAWLAAVVWLFLPRRKQPLEAAGIESQPASLADRLRPLVADAIAGRLSPAKLAELERALIQYWRRRLNLDDLSPSAAIAELRRHPEANPLIRQLEAWLHRPGGDQGVDINALLEPYRNVSPDDLPTLKDDSAGAVPSLVLVREPA